MLKIFFHPSTIISTFFWVGKVPVVSGTLGSLIAFPVWYLLVLRLSLQRGYSGFVAGNLDILSYSLFIIFILFVIGIWSSSIYEQISGKTDPKEVVIDEVVAQLLVISLSVFLLPYLLAQEVVNFEQHKLNPKFLLSLLLFLNFVFFRLFDIVKPWPISLVEKKVKGGLGIMLDDIVAAPFAVLFSFAAEQMICSLIIKFYI